MEILQICDIANKYCQVGENVKARAIIMKRLGKDSAIDSILKNFWSSKIENKNEALRLLVLYVDEKSNENEKQYKNVLYILSNLKDKIGKTLLIYAAEKNLKKLVNELIKNGADVNDLYTLLGKNTTVDTKIVKTIKQPHENKEYVICGFCGKKILRTVKFCNYCGRKLNYKL